MTSVTEPIDVAVLRRIGQLTNEGASNSAIAAVLANEGHKIPRDGALSHYHYAYSHGYAFDNGFPGRPSAWTSSAVAALKATTTYSSLSAAGFPGAGTVALTIS